MMRKMRQSTVNEADTCSWRTKLRLENPDMPRRTSVMRAAGTGYHGGVAAGYMAIRQGHAPELLEMLTEADHELEQELEIAEEMDWRYQVQTSRLDEVVYKMEDLRDLTHRMVKRYFDEDRFWDPTRFTVLGVEQPFVMDWYNGWTRSGTMDLVLYDNDTDWIHVVDHKLTKKKWYANKADASSSVQAAWYIDATRALYQHDFVTFNYDVMSIAGDFQQFDAMRTEQQIEITMKRATMLADTIDKGGPFQPNVQSFLCHEAYCDYWDLCEFGPTLKGSPNGNKEKA